MFKTIFVAAACILLMAPLASAQFAGTEVFVGYTNLQNEGLPNRNTPGWVFDTDFFRDRTTLHGVNAAFTGYGSGILGFTGDFSWARRGTSETVPGVDSTRNTDTYYFMAGPTLKFNRSGSRLQPFVRVMAGGTHTRFEASTAATTAGGTVTNSFEVGSTDFTAAAGGGLDIGMGERVKLRIVQVDYAPVFLRDHTVDVLGSNGVIEPTTLSGQRQDNFRFSVGVTF